MQAASVDNSKLSFEKHPVDWRQAHILKKKLQQSFVCQQERSKCVDRGQGGRSHWNEDIETTRKSRHGQ